MIKNHELVEKGSASRLGILVLGPGLLAVGLLLVFPVLPLRAAEVIASRMSETEKIAALAAEIAAKGYDFKVAPNWITRLPPAERAGLAARQAAAFRGVRMVSSAVGPLQVRSAEELPSVFDWRDIAGHSYIGPVRYQGACGACYAFGACAALEGCLNHLGGLCDSACLDLSEACLAFCLDQYYSGYSGCDGSDYDYRELDALVKKGVCGEQDYPYDGVDRDCPQDYEILPRIRAVAWYRLPCGDITAIKSAILAYGVVDAAVLTSPAFDAYAGGIFRDEADACGMAEPCYYAETDHCVALVGWDDNDGDGYWILRNSWGQSWGEDGYMRIAYDAAHVSCAVCYLVGAGLSGVVWNDIDGDGIRDDGEEGISGWRIFIDENGNGVWDEFLGEPAVLSDAAGGYRFLGLVPGDYRVATVIPDVWEQTFPVSEERSAVHMVTVVAGAMSAGADFGNHCLRDAVRARRVYTCGEASVPCYDDYVTELAELYERAGSGDRIEMQATVFTESLCCDRPVTVALSGGWAADYRLRSGMSVLAGRLTISAGRVTVERLALGAP